jgi:hypothetical protein
VEGYVHDLGTRDRNGVRNQMTKVLQRTFATTMTPPTRNRAACRAAGSCRGALELTRSEQFGGFTTATFDDVKVTGSKHAFVYPLRDMRADSQVALAGGSWKVSCCVPGEEP